MLTCITNKPASKTDAALSRSVTYRKPATISGSSSAKYLKPSFDISKSATIHKRPQATEESKAYASNTIGTMPRRETKKYSISSVPKEVIEQLKDNIISAESSTTTFSDIKGQKETKKAITDNIILPIMNPELFTGIREPSRAILLYGPPGNGKTLLAKALAGQIKRTFFNISASSLMSKFMGEGEKLMKGLFALAEELGPSIIFFDEIDSLLCSRGSGEHEASRRMKTEFLVQFDGVGSSTNGDVLIIAATNRPFDLDDAVLRRFTKKIYVGLPDSEARLAIIEHLFKDEKWKISKDDLKKLIASLHGYSSSDLTALCKEAAMMPISEYKPEELRGIKKKDLRSIKIGDFVEAMKKVKPSYNKKKIQEFIDWENSLGK